MRKRLLPAAVVCLAVTLVGLTTGARGTGKPSRSQQLVYTRADHGVHELVAVDADGTHAHVLWPHSLPIVAFGWRGTTVTYSRSSHGRTTLYAARPGRAPGRLATIPAVVGGFDWSPDGNMLAFATERGITTFDLRSHRLRLLVRDFDLGDARWSPDGARIAFYSGGDIAVVDADGKNVRYLSASSAGSGPVWSPDGKRIAYEGYDQRQILVESLPRGPTSPAMTVGFDCSIPSFSWAPHAEITFAERCSGRSVIEQVKSDGSDRRTIEACCDRPLWSPHDDRLLTTDGANLRLFDPATATSRAVIHPEPGSDSTPHWSRDGTKLAFVGLLKAMVFAKGVRRPWSGTAAAWDPESWAPDGYRIAVSDGDSIAIVDTRTWKTRQVATDCGNGCPSYSAPDWSPDGPYIMFVATDSDSRLAVYDVELRSFASLGVRGNDPAWAPDGRHIAYDTSFASTNDARSSVFVANADGTRPRRVATHASSPAWSRDGKLIAFVRTVGRGNREIFVMNADGSDQRRVTHHSGDDVEPDWR